MAVKKNRVCDGCREDGRDELGEKMTNFFETTTIRYKDHSHTLSTFPPRGSGIFNAVEHSFRTHCCLRLHQSLKSRGGCEYLAGDLLTVPL